MDKIKALLLQGTADMMLQMKTAEGDNLKGKPDVETKNLDDDASSQSPTSSDANTEANPHTGEQCGPRSYKELTDNSIAQVHEHLMVFVFKLKTVFDAICTKYIDLYLEKEGPNAADCLSKQLLVFLVAPEELPSLKRDKSIKEMVREKLQDKKNEEDGDVVSSPVDTPVENVLSTPLPLEGRFVYHN